MQTEKHELSDEQKQVMLNLVSALDKVKELYAKLKADDICILLALKSEKSHWMIEELDEKQIETFNQRSAESFGGYQ